MNKITKISTLTSAFTTVITTTIGLFYSNGGQNRIVENIYGQEVLLYGDGIYANNTLLKVGATKGADIVMLGAALFLMFVIFVLKNKKFAPVLRSGLLAGLLYDAGCISMGLSFNRLFPLYLIWFSTSLFALIFSLVENIKGGCFEQAAKEKKLKGTAVFMILGGCSVLVWLQFIIPAVITGNPTNFIEIYTTEPTYVFDLGVILPVCVGAGVGLLKQKKEACIIASVMMTLVTGVGLVVIFQTIMQSRLGIQLPIGAMIGLVGSFVILGSFAVILNYRLLRKV